MFCTVEFQIQTVVHIYRSGYKVRDKIKHFQFQRSNLIYLAVSAATSVNNIDDENGETSSLVNFSRTIEAKYTVVVCRLPNKITWNNFRNILSEKIVRCRKGTE